MLASAASALLIRIILCLGIYSTYCVADQIVYLERPAQIPTWKIAEPWFSPDTIHVNVGEQIHFVALFGNQRPYRSNMSSIIILVSRVGLYAI